MTSTRKNLSEAKSFAVVFSQTSKRKSASPSSQSAPDRGRRSQGRSAAEPKVALTAASSVLIYSEEGEALGTNIWVLGRLLLRPARDSFSLMNGTRERGRATLAEHLVFSRG